MTTTKDRMHEFMRVVNGINRPFVVCVKCAVCVNEGDQPESLICNPDKEKEAGE